MATQKRKHSSARRDKRRTHWKLNITGMSRCAQCGRPTRSHHVCSSCGTYKGRQVLEIGTKDKSSGA